VTLALAVLGLVQLDLAPVASLIGFSIALVAAENLWQAAGRATWIPCAIAAALAGVAAAAALGHGRLPALTLAGLALFAASYFGLLARADASAPLRSGFAFVFGLVHGLGFAGALLDTAVPADRVAASLFGFNLGIELGQLALVAASLVALRLVRGMSFRDAAVDYASAAALMIGTYWFVARAFA
jgi:hypothetical protein